MTPTEALQAWLALEHEAVWLYPVVGARFAGLRPRASTAFRTHRDTRDALERRIRAAGEDPVANRLTYDVGPLDTEKRALRAARRLEAQISAVCLTLAGAAEGDLRAYAVRNLNRAALAELTWGARPQAFPGLP
ncbi:DUF4439 domain-containing protein [Aeromicrobium chenweiae]|uniref:DUF4439 domain-containing protein n=1 Tax=Aeromicrobium chenweiae TaxID=2079793 RepID=A0A2S0WN58_9ACTN|nr:DUF4439 domain-containing protein [Aeromicrobium chenweiae]AWB92765.1 DUF4439 domain-containing protein [Aeromicrobium chenweiae]TGN33757.1 DUF4439 domain-containing protein [Aeromicrobium chenweiae]